MTTFAPSSACPRARLAALAAAAISLALASPATRAQTTVTLDGTSGSNSISTAYTLSGDTTFDLGFFVDYLVVGGGGAGTTITSGYTNGGGGGDVETGSGLELTSQSYPVTVGSGAAYPGTAGAAAGSSSALGVTAAGGRNSTSSRAGASGSGQLGGAGSYDGSGGGGAGGVGTAGTGGSGTRFSGSGGIGVASDITGSSTYYGGGGAGGYPNGGTGGLGGGGNPSVAGATNTGGGGGGYAAGGSGIVIIRYAGSSVGAIGGTISAGTGAATGTTLHTFTSTGNAAFNLAAVDFNTRLGAVLTNGVGGTGNLAFAGPGRLTLSADSSYVGNTIVSGGTLQVGNGGSAGTLGSGSVTNDSVLAFNRTDALSVANAIAGTGSLVQQGSGTTTLSVANTFTGTSRIAAGTLALGHVDALAGSTLDLEGGDAGAVSFDVAGANAYALGGLQGSRNLANGGNSLAIGGNGSSTTYSGVLSGAGGLTKAGGGILTLSGTNTYGGPTTVSAGTLRIDGDQTGAAGGVTVASGGTLGGSGTIGGATTLQSGGTLSPGNSPGTTTMAGDLTWNGGANYNWQLLDAGGTAGSTSGWDLVNVGGTLDIQATSGTPFNLNLWTLASMAPDVNGQAVNFDRTASHTWTIASATGGIQNFSADKFAINTAATNGTGGFANDTTGGAFTVTTAGNDLNLEFTPGGQQYLNATASAVTTTQHYTTDNGGLSMSLALPVDLLVVGGGGGSGGVNSSYNAGGGGGEAITASGVQVTSASNGITIGSGGAYGTSAGGAGGSSSALGFTAAGGAGAVQTAIGGASGSGNAGGAASSGPAGGQAGGGGGGQTAAGSAGVYVASPLERVGGAGGAGLTSSISGTSLMYGFGGGGQAPTVNAASGNGLNGDGTAAAPRANSGGGGWANTAGADGTVVIRYSGAQAATGGTVTTDGGDTIHTFTGNGTFAVGNVRATLSGAIEGSGNFTFDGPGTLALSATNTYAGTTTISAGTLQVGGGGTTGTLGGTGAVSNDGTLAFNRSDAVTLARGVSGTGSLTQAGSGTLTLSGTNTYSGGTTISAGTLVGTATSLQGDIANASALVFDDATGGTYSGVISGNGTFEKTGAGNVILSGANTFTGGITVSAGTLSTNAADRLAATAAPSVASGATLSLGGDQTLAIVTGSGTLDLSAGTLSMGGTTGEFAGTLTGAGDLAKVGAGTLTLSGAASSFTGTTTLSGGSLILANANALGTASVLSMAAGTTLRLNQRTYVGDFDQFGGTIDGPGELVATLFRTESGTLDVVIADDDGNVARGIRKIAAGTTTVTAANTFTGLVRVDDGTLALGSGGSFAAASSALVEGGTLDLNGTSTTFTALDGTGGSVALGAGTLTINNANASDYSGVIAGTGGSLVKTGAGTLTLTGTNTFDSGITVSAGRLAGSVASLPGAITNNAEIEFNEAAAATLATVVSGTGDLIKTGAGTLTIDAAQTFTGTLEVAAGTVDLGGSGSLDSGITLATSGTGTFAVGSNSLDVAALSGSAGSITLADGTLTVTNASAASYGGAITGSGSLIKAGAGTLTLTGTNAVTTGGTGGTIVSAGRLVGTTASVNGRMQIDSGATLELDQATTGTLAGSLIGSGDFEKTGVGNLTVGSTNGSYSGDVTISAGTLTVGSGSGDTFAGLGTGGIVNNASLALNRSNYFFSQAISGTGQVVQVAGNTVINSANSYSGGTVLSGGKVTVQNDAALGTSGTISFEGGTLEYSQALTTDLSSRFSTAANQAYAIEVSAAGPITLASALTSTGGTLTKTGNGTLVLSGANTYSGGTTVSAGGLEVTTSSLPGNASVAAGARLDFNQSTVGSYSDVISGQGQLRKRGSGTVTLSGSNTYSGGTTIFEGTLVGGVANIPGDISLDGIAPGAATLEFAQATDATYSGVISTNTAANTGSVVKSGVGNLILSGANTYTQPTSVAAGRLSVNGSLGTSAVTVQSGGELGGSGILGGTVTVANGGRLAPGNSIGVLTEGATSFASGATFEYEVDSSDLNDLANAADLLVVNGNLDIAAGTLLEFSDLAAQAQAFVEDSTVFAMINYTGTWDGGLFTYNGQSLADGSRFSVGSQLWEIDYDFVGTLTEPLNFRNSYVPASGTQTFVTVTAVPEPATLALLAAAVGLAALDARRPRA